MDDQAIMRSDKKFNAKLKGESENKLKMKYLGALTHIVGVKIKRDRRNGVLTFHQGSHMRQVLER